MRDQTANKIDSLLLTEGCKSLVSLLADILRAKENFGTMSGRPYIDYIKEFIAMNRPYDEWVKDAFINRCLLGKRKRALAILREIKECS